MADSVLSGKLLITESAESIRGSSSVFTDPYERSVNYMETHNILQIFQVRKNKAAELLIYFLTKKMVDSDEWLSTKWRSTIQSSNRSKTVRYVKIFSYVKILQYFSLI